MFLKTSFVFFFVRFIESSSSNERKPKKLQVAPDPCNTNACPHYIFPPLMVTMLMLLLLLDTPRRQVTAWGVLASITRAREARRLFVGAGGLGDMEGVLVRVRVPQESWFNNRLVRLTLAV